MFFRANLLNCSKNSIFELISKCAVPVAAQRPGWKPSWLQNIGFFEFFGTVQHFSSSLIGFIGTVVQFWHQHVGFACIYNGFVNRDDVFIVFTMVFITSVLKVDLRQPMAGSSPKGPRAAWEQSLTNSHIENSFFRNFGTAMQKRKIGEGPEQMLYIVHKLMYSKYYVRLYMMTCELGGQLASFGLAHPSLS